MGAGKSTLGPELAERLGRPFVSVDAVVEQRDRPRRSRSSSPQRGQDGVPRARGARRSRGARAARPRVVELGGGALGSEPTRAALAEHAFTVLLETTPDEAWARVSVGHRPLARDPEEFRALFAERAPAVRAASPTAARATSTAPCSPRPASTSGRALSRLLGLCPATGR